MMLLDKITQDLNTYLKNNNPIAVSALRLLLSSIHNAEIAKGQKLTDEDILAEVAKDVKRHKESITDFEKGQRMQLAQKEKAELLVLQNYLPKPMEEAEIEQIIDEVITRTKPESLADMGKVMSEVMAKVAGKADGSKVAEMVKSKIVKN